MTPAAAINHILNSIEISGCDDDVVTVLLAAATADCQDCADAARRLRSATLSCWR
jgi:hypothetical protein